MQWLLCNHIKALARILWWQSSSAKAGANAGAKADANLCGKADRPLNDFADHARDLEQQPQGAAVAQNPASFAPLPFDFAPPAQPSYGGKSTPLQIGAQTWSALEAMAKFLHVPPISVLLWSRHWSRLWRWASPRSAPRRGARGCFPVMSSPRARRWESCWPGPLITMGTNPPCALVIGCCRPAP
jgi:hypothetical protein